MIKVYAVLLMLLASALVVLYLVLAGLDYHDFFPSAGPDLVQVPVFVIPLMK